MATGGKVNKIWRILSFETKQRKPKQPALFPQRGYHIARQESTKNINQNKTRTQSTAIIRKAPQRTKSLWRSITKTRLFKCIKNFITKNENFQMKNSVFFFVLFCFFSYFCSKHILWVLVRTASRGGSNKYPQSMFLSRNKKINVYPCKPQLYCIKVGFKGSKLYTLVFTRLNCCKKNNK